MYKRFFPFFALVLFLSCSKELSLEGFSFTDQSTSFGGNRFAVVTEKYITSVDIPSDSGITVSQLRCGDVFVIEETRLIGEKTKELWVKIQGGWVKETALQLYRTKEKAETASSRLKKQ